jgi:histidinol-phosphate aminotransferase
MGSGFEPYRWADTPVEVAVRHGLSPAHVLRFDANLPAFPGPLPVTARLALAQRAEYPEGSFGDLREAAAVYADCDPDEIAVDAGADGLIHLVARTFLGPGRRAVVERPTYPLYAIASRIEGAEVSAAPRSLDSLTEAARGAHVLWLCNPGNPCGELVPPEEVARLADALPETLVCVDEAYFEYCGETAAPLARTRANLVCVRTLSKAFGLAGLRVGYAVASRDLTRELTARRTPAPIATTAALLAAEALRRPEVAHAEAAAAREERERLRAAFAAAGYDAPTTHANFVVVRTREARALAARLERRGLVVRDYAEALRISVRSPADDDLVLRELGIEPPPASRRSATMRRAGLRVSLVLDGGGRAVSLTGDEERDRRIEADAAAAGWDLEVVAQPEVADDAVDLALAEAEEQARLARVVSRGP